MKSSLYSVFYVGILFTAGLNATVTQGPSNTVAEIGKQVKLTCTANAPVGYWILSKDGTATDQLIIVGPGCGAVNAPFGNHYTIEPIGGGTTCNLNIFDITMEQGGVYKCLEATSVNASIFTVIDPNPSITVTNGSGVVAGDQVIMSYTVRYNSSTASSQTPTIQPVLTWKDSNGNNIPGSATPGVNSVTSILSLRAERQAMQPYTCRISYEIKKTSTANGISFADNIPNSVSTPPSTPTIDVAYAPIISSITTSQPVCPGKTVEITCHATANPAPTYSWIGPDARNYSGETIEAVMNGTYSCTASNVIKGSTRSDTKQATLSVLCWLWLLLLLWCLNPISAGIFLVHYCSQDRGDFNKRYLFLDKMFPCMNNSPETPCKKSGWITLFIAMMIFSGIQFLILTIVTYAGCKNPENTIADENKYKRMSEDQTAVQNAKQTKQDKVNYTKSKQRKSGKSTEQDKSADPASEEQNNASHAAENGGVDGNGCSPNPGTTHKKYAMKSEDQTAEQKLPQKAKQTKQDNVSYPKNEQRQTGKSTEQDKSADPASEEQNNASHASGTKFQKFCFALALAYMILGIILFAISVGVIYYECNRQCYKK